MKIRFKILGNTKLVPNSILHDGICLYQPLVSTIHLNVTPSLTRVLVKMSSVNETLLKSVNKWTIRVYPRDMVWLTHWNRTKMADVFQTQYLNSFSYIKIILFWFKCQKILFTINNKSAVVQVMTWWAGDKPSFNQWWHSSRTHTCVTWP